MDLKDVGKKKFLGKGFCAECYTLKKGNVLKIFNNPKDLHEIDRFRYFLKHSNESFLFPFEFIYDSKKFYGYITKYVKAKTLDEIFPKSNLIDLSTHSYKLEKNIDDISKSGIALYDFHDENVLYDGKKYTVIDPDENSITTPNQELILQNRYNHRIMIANLLEKNIRKAKNSTLIKEKINKYKYLNMKPSEMLVQVKEDLDKYYKEDVQNMEQLQEIVRR